MECVKNMTKLPDLMVSIYFCRKFRAVPTFISAPTVRSPTMATPNFIRNFLFIYPEHATMYCTKAGMYCAIVILLKGRIPSVPTYLPVHLKLYKN